MTVAATAAPDPVATPELPMLLPERRPIAQWLSRGISVALLAAVALQLEQAGTALIDAVIPDSLAFWLSFAAVYLALPVADWVIFRKLWRLPASGFPVLLRKRISNELLLSYSGEVYFYLWARRKSGLTTAPFGAIKDINILSALAANLVTLALLAAALPFIGGLLGDYSRSALLSAGAILLVSLGILLFSRHLFTLPRRELGWILAVHLARILATTLLVAVAWSLALPAVPLGLWLVLATLRMLVGRLPFVPGKELLFATAAFFLVGGEGAIPALMAMMAALTLGVHILLGTVLTLLDLAGEARR